MSQISTLSEFLLQAGTDYRIFDMGRGIRKISSQAFLDIENAILQPQYPRAQHAWFGIVFWNKQLSNQHYIWFVKLPLDEQGLMIAAGRNHFLQIIVEALGAQLEQNQQKNGQLPENPYSFIPNQQQLADFNSISRKHLKLPQSQYYQAAIEYVSNPTAEDWQGLSLQGVADLASNIAQPDVLKALQQNFVDLPQPLQYSLCCSFENHPLPTQLAETLQHWLLLNDDHAEIWQHGLRALAQSTCTGLVGKLIRQCLAKDQLATPNNLMIISGRLWTHLQQDEVRTLFVEKLAELDGDQPLFAAVFTDLVQIPQLRHSMLTMLRAQHKSIALTQAIGKLFKGSAS